MREWIEKPLNQLVTFQKGRKVDTSSYCKDGYSAYLGASGIEGREDGYGDPRFGVIAKPSDTLMLWDGERSGLVGFGQHGVVASTVSKLSPNESIDPQYLYFSLLAKFDWIQHRRTGTGVPHVPKDLGRILKIRFPKRKAAQAKIATILSTIDTAIEQTEALIEKYQHIKAGLMHDLFTRGVLPNGQLRPPREQAPELYQETAIGWIPREWQISTLAECISASPKNGYSPREVDTWEGLYVLGLGCLTRGGFEAKQLKNAPGSAVHSGAVLLDGDFLISRANTPELVGLCGVYEKLDAPAIYPDLMMRLSLLDFVDKHFVEAQLLLPATRARLTALAVGTSSSMAKLNASAIKQFQISVPSLEEQKLVIDKLKVLQQSIRSNLVGLSKLQTQKLGLMQDLLTGKVSVTVDATPSEAVE